MAEKKKTFKSTPNLAALAQNEAALRFLAGEESPQDKSTTKTETPVEAPAAAVVTNAPAPAASPTQAAPEQEYAWMNSSAEARVQHIVRIPDQLKHLLVYLGQTTFGANMTSICTDGLTEVARKLAEERGLPLPADFGSWVKKK